MSGIVALSRAGREQRGDDVQAAHDILAALQHRGPDRQQVIAQGSTVLGHCLLRTLPEDDAARMPLASRDGALLVAADARIDNRADVCRDPTVSDAHAILEAYERWGTDAARHLLGDFAFAIWDSGRRHLYCARDPLATRPLFYSIEGGVFRCASEPHALFADRRLRVRPDPVALALYIAHEYHEVGPTLYQGVSALAGGHELIVSEQGVEERAYWRPDPHARLPRMTDRDYAALLRQRFEEAVKARCRSSTPIGVTVSGGMDSSSVACEAERQRRVGVGPSTPITALHLTYPGLSCDETRHSRAVVERWDLAVLEVDAMAQGEAVDPRLTERHPDLYYHPGGYLWGALYQRAPGHGIRTVLTGEGGDTLLCSQGVEPYLSMQRGDLLGALRSAGVLDEPLALHAWRRLWREAILLQAPPWVSGMVRALLGKRRFGPFLSAEMSDAVRDVIAARRVRAQADRYPDPLTALMCLRLEGSIAVMAMTWLERLAMRAGVEQRHPFYDRRVVETLLAMPREQLHQPGLDKPKPVLRRAVRHLLPPTVYRRVDSAEYTSHHVYALELHGATLRRLFEQSRLVQLGIVEPAAALAAKSAGTGTQINRILDLATLEIWLRQLERRP